MSNQRQKSIPSYSRSSSSSALKGDDKPMRGTGQAAMHIFIEEWVVGGDDDGDGIDHELSCLSQRPDSALSRLPAIQIELTEGAVLVPVTLPDGP